MRKSILLAFLFLSFITFDAAGQGYDYNPIAAELELKRLKKMAKNPKKYERELMKSLCHTWVLMAVGTDLNQMRKVPVGQAPTIIFHNDGTMTEVVDGKSTPGKWTLNIVDPSIDMEGKDGKQHFKVPTVNEYRLAMIEEKDGVKYLYLFSRSTASKR